MAGPRKRPARFQKRNTRPIPTWEEWWAQQTRRLNEPTPQVFRPDVGLNPSQVDDIRGPQPILASIYRWFLSTDPVRNVKWMAQGSGPKVDFPLDTPFGKLQQSHRDYERTRNMPQPGPAPSPSRISNPGLLSKYRR